MYSFGNDSNYTKWDAFQWPHHLCDVNIGAFTFDRMIDYRWTVCCLRRKRKKFHYLIKIQTQMARNQADFIQNCHIFLNNDCQMWRKMESEFWFSVPSFVRSICHHQIFPSNFLFELLEKRMQKIATAKMGYRHIKFTYSCDYFALLCMQ